MPRHRVCVGHVAERDLAAGGLHGVEQRSTRLRWRLRDLDSLAIGWQPPDQLVDRGVKVYRRLGRPKGDAGLTGEHDERGGLRDAFQHGCLHGLRIEGGCRLFGISSLHLQRDTRFGGKS